MISQSIFGHYGRIIKLFVSTRGLEVLALQASPIIGSSLGGLLLSRGDLLRCGLMLLGSLLLTAHVFVFNDWAGHSSDRRDPRRGAHLFFWKEIGRGQIARVAIALLILSSVALAAVSWSALVIGTLIATLSLLYSSSRGFGKSTPVAASFHHLIGGMWHFLLGYTAFHAMDLNGVVCSLFFGLVFAAGHLNQEVRDYEGDRLNGIRTSAVVFGCRRTFLASMCLFTAAYALVISLAAAGILPKLLLGSVMLWLLQVAWSWQALQRGLGIETALWMQRRYRLMFAVIGLAMLVRW